MKKATPKITRAAVLKARRLLFAMLAKVSTVDGALDGREAGLTIDLAAFAGDDRESCIKAFATARRSRKSLFDYADELRALRLPESHRRDIYALLWRVAIADGILRATEKFLLRDTCARLGLEARFFNDLYRLNRATFADEELNDPGT